MTDRIVGYPTNLTTVSNNGAGFVRVTLAPWELDWEWFDLMAVDGSNYLANTTTGVAVAITAKGGAENTGYWFDINQAFPSANWVTGNRITPQRQVGINQYATIAAAMAALANNDTMMMWYSNTINQRIWSGNFSFFNKGGSIWGMLSRKQIHLFHTAHAVALIQYSGNLVGQNVQAFVVNASLATTGNTYDLYYAPTVGQAGAGVRISRCLFIGGRIGIVSTNAAANTFQVDNSIFLGCFSVGAVTYPHYSYFNTTIRCYTGMSYNVLGRNCVDIESGQGFLNLGWQYCADTDGSLPVHATNLRNQNMRTQLLTFYDLASPGQKKFPDDPRIQRGSVLVGAGVQLAAVPVDADGRTRPNPPAQGAYEPYEACYAPGSEIIRGASKRGVKT
jgi:hypothetical protein